MVEHLLSLRGLMFFEGITALFLFSWVVGIRFFQHGWPFKITAIGSGGLLAYISAGQIKAAQRDSPFDIYAWVGFTFLPVFITGLILYAVAHHRED